MQIREASERDMGALYELASHALDLDRFSQALLAEKLFDRRRPSFAFHVYLAQQADRPLGFLQCVHAAERGKAWIGILAASAAARRQGIATALFEHARRRLPASVNEIEVLALPGNYFNPGLDPRYTAALAFFEHLGFERFKDCVNLRCELSSAWQVDAEEKRLREAGVDIRRAAQRDASLLDAFFASNFGPDWRYEAELAMAANPLALHLALREGRIIGFAAHSAQNREWGFFGPMGSAAESRGLGVGRVLLWRCLNDLRAAGHASAVIPWVGPISFYSRWTAARVERVFWRYRLQLQR